jgi:hypothetical protein
MTTFFINLSDRKPLWASHKGVFAFWGAQVSFFSFYGKTISPPRHRRQDDYLAQGFALNFGAVVAVFSSARADSR